MIPEQPATTLRRPRNAAAGGMTGELSDGQLLQRFAAQRDEAAFAALVHRHGPLVLAVCRRVLGRTHDGVEDAFQATFLVLIRKAGSLRRPELLGNWLYGVAYRIARKARASADLRRRHEAEKAASTPVVSAPETNGDALHPVLDEELHRLPDKYRLPLVLCYLEGLTNEEAARQLRWPTGTVKGRLARARDLLRHRLVRRGLAVPVGLLVLALTESSARGAVVPAALADGTLKAGLAFAAAGQGAPSGPTTLAAALAEGFLCRARRYLWATVAAALLTAATVATAATVVGTYIVGEGLPVSGPEPPPVPCDPPSPPPPP